MEDDLVVNPSSALLLSWQRSEASGVDPFAIHDSILPAHTLQQYIEQKQHLLEQIEPIVNKSFAWIQNNQATVLIADSDGYILANYGDPGFLEKADRIHLMKGACWAEHIRGTNAIGTSLVEQKAISVVGPEHYFHQNRFLFCAASPIFDQRGNLAAILDVSGYHNQYHPSILALVEQTACNIEDWALVNDLENQVVVSITVGEHEWPQALLALDGEGRLIGANRAARLLLWNIGLGMLDHHAMSTRFTDWSQLLSQSGTNAKQTVTLVSGGQNIILTSRILINRQKTAHAFHRDGNVSTRPGLYSQGHHSQWRATHTFEQIHGHDEQLVKALDLARRAAQTDYNIFISGETGTGKEMVGQSIHLASRRASKPFIAINCGALSKSLLESELFGYEAGSFTGAKQSGHPGKFELANEGTLFLDEIADMPLEMQTSLLRVLQERTVVRIGGVKPIQVDVRIIAATHKDLWMEVENGRFRSDLYFRLQGIAINLPPLRDRSDTLELAAHFLRTIAAELGKSALLLTPDAQTILSRYSWPGNVRELLAVLRQAAFLTSENAIEPRHFPAHIHAEVMSSLPRPEETQNQQSLQTAEQQLILEVLEKVNGNISKAAKLLGIGRSTLYRKLREIAQ